MLKPDSFRTHSLDKHPSGDAIRRVLFSSIDAVEPGRLVKQAVQREGNSIIIDAHEFPLESGRIVLLGLGKAAEAMVTAMVDLLGDLNPRGLMIPKNEPSVHPRQVEVNPGGHPIPDEKSLLAGRKVIKLAKSLTERDLFICMFSGGGSALMAATLDGVSLGEVQQLYSTLLACGADIEEINTIRRHLDQLKGGGLAKLASGTRVVSLILSDVIGNSLQTIASGPTAPDPSTKEEALMILEKYSLIERIPSSILTTLQNVSETPKQNDWIFEKVSNYIIGSNDDAIQGAIEQARIEGYHCRSLGSSWQGEARTTARTLCAAFENPAMERPYCMVGGGETSVSIKGQGRGGRNQELALASAIELADKENVMLIAMATDGEEGLTNASGAVATGETLQRGNKLGMDAARFLEDNDSYPYFETLGDLIKCGPSGTNVNDLYLLFGH
ncbi:MAG TPA: DUF4147 domain-containing protein [Anaerolineales bacterium]|nr:DUF4147 domain-containing protein [Anaerolineales bacterium]